MKRIRLLLAIFLTIVGASLLKAQDKQAYALLSDDGTTLTFYYNSQKASLVSAGKTVYEIPFSNVTPDCPGWTNTSSGNDVITTVTLTHRLEIVMT